MRTPVLLLSTDPELAGAFEADPKAGQYDLTIRSGPLESSEQIARRYLVVVLDYRTVDEAPALGPALRLLNPNLEFIPVVGKTSERAAIDALRRGAFDYTVFDEGAPYEPVKQLHRCLRRFMDMAPPMEPQRFGPYWLVKKLGTGGMAEVFLAQQGDRNDKMVVVKKIRPDLTGKPEFETMFMDEARITSQLDHENIVGVLDFGRVDDELFMAMEYIRGTNLQRLGEAASWKFRPEIAAYIVAEVCSGLDYSHRLQGSDGKALNIIHRDINPPNVLISTDGKVKLADFGIARAEERYTETISGVVKGKISWLSPEQARGLPIDRRSDVFGIGVVLYVLLTGVHPFHEGARGRTLKRIRQAQTETLDTYRDDLPPVFQTILDNVLTASPNDRYPSAYKLETELRRYLSTGDEIGANQVSAVMARFPSLMSDDVVATASSGSIQMLTDSEEIQPAAATAVVGVPSPQPEPATTPANGDDPTPVREDPRIDEVTHVADDEPNDGTPTPLAPPVSDSGRMRQYVSEHTEPGTRVVARPQPPADTGTDQIPIFPESAQRQPRSWAPWIMGGVVASLLLGGGVGLWSLQQNAGPTAVRTLPPVTLPPTQKATRVVRASQTSAASPTPQETSTPVPTATPVETHKLVRGTATPPRVRTTATSRPTPLARPTRTPPPARQTGTVSIWVDSWAYVSVNGRRLDVVAPVSGIRLPAGRHRITLENPRLSQKRELDVVVRPGKESKISLRLQ